MKDHHEMMDFLKRAYTEVEKHASQLTINKNKPQHLFALALYIKLFELTASCLILIAFKVTTGLPILIRGVLEAYVDLINLCKDPTYINFMQASYFKEWLRILNEAATSQNPNLRGTAQLKTLPYKIKFMQTEREGLKQKGYKVLSVEDRFKKAEMGAEYRSTYNILCCYSHNNMRSLVDVNTNADGEISLIISDKASSIKDIPYYVELLCDYFINASCQIHKFLDSSVYGEIVELKNEMYELIAQARPENRED